MLRDARKLSLLRMRAIFFNSCLILKRRVSAVSKDEVRRPPDGLLLNEKQPSRRRADGGRPLAPRGRQRKIHARARPPTAPGTHPRYNGPRPESHRQGTKK